MICTIIIRLGTVKKENQVHGNLTNKDWRKASNIINSLCTHKGYNNSRPKSNRQTVQSW